MEHIFPHIWFENSSNLLLLLYLILSFAMVVRGADWLVEGAVGLSERLGVPKVIIGATVVSLGTTTPEAAVSVMAAFQGEPGLALGNSVGSIICDTGLIFGICCLLTRLPKDPFVLKRHGRIQFGAGVLLVVVSLCFKDDEGARVIPRFIGLLFVALLVGYLWISLRWARQHRASQPMVLGQTESELAAETAGQPLLAKVGWLVAGLAMVLLGSDIMINSVVVLCDRWGVPPGVVAATVIAFGTSLPELATGIASVIKGHKDLLVGNIIGADILNVLFVTGAAACAAPLVVDPLFLWVQFPFMIVILLLFRCVIVFGHRGTFARWPGVLFLGLYVFYSVANYVWGRG